MAPVSFGESPLTDSPRMESPAKKAAQWYSMPHEPVVSIEHPCVVRNIDNGIKSLGGEVQLDRFIKLKHPKKNISVSLRPGDPTAKPIESRAVKTQNLLLKVTVPKRTGRKRKRGSSGPFQEDATPRDPDAELVLQCMRDNPQRYSVGPVGLINEAHRFRFLPDFQYATSTEPLMQNMRHSILTFDYENLKKFDINLDKGMRPGVSVGPPGAFSPLTIPFDYGYRQNPFLKFTKDDAGRLIATSIYGRLHRTMVGTCAWNDDTVLFSPPNPLEPEEKLDKRLGKVLRDLRAKARDRPIWTRRALKNQFLRNDWEKLKLAYPYVFYSFKDGPWANAMIAFGLDPRSDPKYRMYQTIVFKITAQPGESSNPGGNKHVEMTSRWSQIAALPDDNTSHIFDGKKVTPDGRIWQVCDVKDPLVRRILDTNNLRTQCDAQHDGWYHNGTWAKARIIMRDKAMTILEGGTPDDASYEKLARLPDIIDRTNLRAACFGRRANHTAHEYFLASEIRSAATGFHNNQQRANRTRLRESRVLNRLDEADSETPEAAAADREGSLGEGEEPVDFEQDDMDGIEEGPRETQQAEAEDSDVEVEDTFEDAGDGDTVVEGGRETGAGRSRKRPGNWQNAADDGLDDGQAEEDMDDEQSEPDLRSHSGADPDEELVYASEGENSVGFEDDEDMDGY